MTTLTAQAFVAKWRTATLKERSATQEHFIDLCRLTGQPTPAEADPTENLRGLARNGSKSPINGSKA
jgi:hypothetical protein